MLAGKPVATNPELFKSVDFVHPSMSVGVFFAVHLYLEICAEWSWAEHFVSRG
jgi:hypothetical protein